MSQPIPAVVVDQLLEKLSTDDSFRDLYARNPEAAFERLGYPPTKEQLACCTAGKLASKEVIAVAKKEMRDYFIAGLQALRPHKLDEEWSARSS